MTLRDWSFWSLFVYATGGVCVCVCLLAARFGLVGVKSSDTLTGTSDSAATETHDYQLHARFALPDACTQLSFPLSSSSLSLSLST